MHLRMTAKIFLMGFLFGMTYLLAACSSSEYQPESWGEFTPLPPDVREATSTPMPLSTRDEEESTESCPNQRTTYELFADHEFWTDAGLGEWHWDANGTVPLIVEPDGSFSGGSTGIIMGSQYGTFSSGSNVCQFEAPAEINVSVSGICLDGVLLVEITESWDMGTYDWICDEDSFQYDIPSIGSVLHPNLAFKLSDQSSSTVEIP